MKKLTGLINNFSLRSFWSRNWPVVIACIFALTAAVGNVPYGYRFAGSILPKVQPYLMMVGIVFALAATLTNAMLGAYSLLKMREMQMKNRKKLLLISFLGAVPIGFICFFGYRDILSVPINVCISFAVTLVNGAIGYVALCSLVDNAARSKSKLLSYRYLYSHIGEMSIKGLGFFLGICVSLVGYVASANGLQTLFEHYKWSGTSAINTAYVIAIIAWVPFAALYADSTLQLFSKLYEQLIKLKSRKLKNIFHFSAAKFFQLCFILLSGSALTQITIEVFAPSNTIAEIFKQDSVQMLIRYFLVPAAFISVVSVNYLAFENFIRHFRGSSKNSK